MEDHRLHLSESDGALADVVATFVADGLVAGEPVLVIASGVRAAGVRSRMSALGVDDRSAVDRGRLHFIDSDALLDARSSP